VVCVRASVCAPSFSGLDNCRGLERPGPAVCVCKRGFGGARFLTKDISFTKLKFIMASTVHRVSTVQALQSVAPARRSNYELLRDVVVCHLSPVESRRDERAFTRQALPSTTYGLRAQIIGPHPGNGQNQGIEMVPLSKSHSRALRILLASRFLRTALRQKADIYHVHSPELIPVALMLKVIFGKRGRVRHAGRLSGNDADQVVPTGEI